MRRRREGTDRGVERVLIITVHVNAPAGQAIGIKEQIAMDLERYGDTSVVSVKEVGPEQMRIEQEETT